MIPVTDILIFRAFFIDLEIRAHLLPGGKGDGLFVIVAFTGLWKAERVRCAFASSVLQHAPSKKFRHVEVDSFNTHTATFRKIEKNKQIKYVSFKRMNKSDFSSL